MMTLDINKISQSQQAQQEAFYAMGQSQENILLLKRLFILPQGQQLLGYENLSILLFSASLHNQVNLLQSTLELMNKNGLHTDSCMPMASFNVACAQGHLAVMQCLDENLNLISSALQQEGRVILNKEGKIIFYGSVDYVNAEDSRLMIQIKDYQNNILLFNCLKQHINALEMIFDSKTAINESLLDSAFILSCEGRKHQTLHWLYRQPRIREMMMSSSNINLYLHEGSQHVENKDCAKKIFKAIELEEKLPSHKINNKKTKL